MSSRKPLPSRRPPVVHEPPSVAAYLAALEARDIGSGTRSNHRKVLRAAERDLGHALHTAPADAWQEWTDHLNASHAPTSAAVRVRIARAYLRWAGAAVPECLTRPSEARHEPPAWTAALEAWAGHQRAAGLSPHTIETRRQHLRQFALDGAAGADPWAVTRALLLAWMGSHPGWSPETRYGVRASLRGFYGWATDEGHIGADPSAKLPRVKRPPAHARPLPVTHLQTAAAAADDRLALMLTLAAGHGLRRAEIAAVHARDVVQTPGDGWALLVQGKGRRVRRLPIAERLAERITSSGGYVFPGEDGGHLSPRWVGRLLTRALPEGWTAHTARHLFATTAYQLAGDLFTVQDLLGHASADTTRRYVLTREDTKRATVQGVAAALARPREPARAGH